MKTLIIVATTQPTKFGIGVDYPTVILFGQSDDNLIKGNLAVEFIGRFQPEETDDDYAHPELINSNYDKLMEFAKLKYMEYFDTDDFDITFINQYIYVK